MTFLNHQGTICLNAPILNLQRNHISNQLAIVRNCCLIVITTVIASNVLWHRLMFVGQSSTATIILDKASFVIN